MSSLSVSIIMGVLFAGIILWDVYLALDKRKGNTISERVEALDNTLLPLKVLLSFGFGLLIGHWFW